MMSNSRFRAPHGMWWRVLIILFGLIIILAAYYIVHKPITISQASIIGGGVIDLITVSLLALTSGGLGRRVLCFFGEEAFRQWSRAERVALEGALGLGIMGIFALLFGLVGLYRGIILWGYVSIVALLSLHHITSWLRDAILVIRHAQPRNTWERFLAVVSCILLFMAILHAFAPPFAWDALAYHLVGPVQYLSAGQIVADQNNFFMGFPQGTELVYGMSIALFGRTTAAAPLHALYGIYGLLAMGGLVQRYTSRHAAWLSVVLLLSAPSLWLQFGWPYVDLALLAYGACTLVAVSGWQGQPDTQSHLVLAGLYIGFALGAKYMGGALLFAVVVYIFISSRKDRRLLLRSEMMLLSAALLVFAPWLVKGQMLYRNPVYPFVFNGLNWDSERTRTFATAESGLVDSGYWWQIPILPLAATILGVEKGEVLPGASYFFDPGPWLLVAPAILILGWRWLHGQARTLGRMCVGLATPLLGFWVVTAILSPVGTQTRLMIVGLPVIAAGGALAVESLASWPHKPIDLFFVIRAALSITLSLGLLQTLSDSKRAILYYLTPSSGEYLDNALGTHISAMRQLTALPSGTQVRLLWEPRSLYCPIHIVCLPDVVLDQWSYSLRLARTPDQVFALWKAQGDDFLLLFQDGLRFYLTEDRRFAAENAQFASELENHMQRVWSDEFGSYALYTWDEDE